MENAKETRKYQVAEIQLTYKSNVKPSLRPKITGSMDAYNVLLDSWEDNKLELIELKVLPMNRANKVLEIFEVSTGGIAGTVADPKLIFVAAIKGAATGIIWRITIPPETLHPVRLI